MTQYTKIMADQVNYIKHHRSVYFKMSEDVRLTPYHLSVYNALFMLWNECGYANELSINRNDVMMLSKIGNANTYTKCLKNLSEYGYIIYKPSFNPLIGSKVTIIRCDKGGDIGSAKGGSKGSDKGSDKGGGAGGDTLYKQLNLETIQTKETNEQALVRFDTFWDLYGKKEETKKCRVQFLKLSEDVQNKILQVTPLYVKKTPDKQFRKLPSTWLNNECWNDDYSEFQPKPQVKPNIHQFNTIQEYEQAVTEWDKKNKPSTLHDIQGHLL